MLKRFFSRFRNLNPILLASMIGLGIIGVMFVYSACSIREDADLQMLYVRHAEVGLVGLVLYLLAAFVDYRPLMRLSVLFYSGCLVLLVLVPVIGEETMGARRWLFGIQPSEPAKLGIITILLTGGVAHDSDFVEMVIGRVQWIAPVLLYPGEDELLALAEGAMRVLRKEETPMRYGDFVKTEA